MAMTSYWDLEGLGDVYLEDSWVLDVVAHPGVIWFELDLVLRENHSQFEVPKPGEQHCYKRARLVFREVKEVHWNGQGRSPAVDAAGETDYGSIDELVFDEQVFRALGDFGTVEITTSVPPEIEFSAGQ